jgi:hypothetical protein
MIAYSLPINLVVGRIYGAAGVLPGVPGQATGDPNLRPSQPQPRA